MTVTHDNLLELGPEFTAYGCHEDAKLVDGTSPKPAALCEPTGALSDDDFSFAGVSYEIDELHGNFSATPGSQILLALDRPIRDSLRHPLQLRVKGSGAGSADLTLPLADCTNPRGPTTEGATCALSSRETGGDGTFGYYSFFWKGLAIPNWQRGARFHLSLERVEPWVSLQKVDRMLRVLWTMPGAGTVKGWDVHYTASSSVGGNAPAGTDAATGWVDTDSTGTAGIHEIGGLTNGTEYRVRVRARWAGGAGGADILSPWGFRSGAPEKVPPSQLTPDPNFLTEITFNDGVRDLPVEPNIANAVGFGGPGWYAVHVPPGVRSVSVAPTWTSADVIAVVMTVRNITLGKDQPDERKSWAADENGDGSAVTMGQGYGSVRVNLEVTTTTRSVNYKFLLMHNNAWKSADDRLRQLKLEIGN